MAARFWVTVAGSGTGTWDNSLTLHWSTTSGGLGGSSAPVAGDTVTFDANSCPAGEVVTVNADVNITSLTMGAFTGTLDFSANNNSPTMQTFSGTGTGTRTLNMGSGTWTITGSGTSWNMTTVTNLTFSAGTSLINFTDSSATTKVTTFNNTLTYADITYSAGSGAFNLNVSCRNLSFAGYTGIASLVTTTTTVSGNLTFGLNQPSLAGSQAFTLSATTSGKTITNNGVTVNRSITLSGVSGVWTLQDDMNLGTGSLTLTNGDFEANNKNVTLTTFSSSNSNTRTLTMGSGTWTLTGNNGNIWATSVTTNMTWTATTATVNFSYSGSVGTRTLSGMTGPGTAVHNPRVLISAGTDTIAFGNSSSGFQSMDFTGFSGTLSAGSATTLSFREDLILSPTMTNSYTGAISFNGTTLSSTSGTITTNGIVLASVITIGVSATAISWMLGSNLVNTSTITFTQGTFSANNFDVTATTFSSSNSTARTLTMGSGTWTLTGTGTVWNTATITGLTLNANTSTLEVNDASATDKTLSLGALTYYALYLTGGGTGKMIIGTTTSTKTFHSITVDPPLTVQVFAGSTLALSAPFLLISGNGGQINTFQSTTNGVAWNITASSGTFNENYLSLQDSAASGGATFYAGGNSTNVSGNSGWIFTDAPDTEQTAVIDANGAHGLLAASSEDGKTPIRVYADANTHALFISIV